MKPYPPACPRCGSTETNILAGDYDEDEPDFLECWDDDCGHVEEIDDWDSYVQERGL